MAFFCAVLGAGRALIPEISPPLIQEEVFACPGRLAGDIIFPCAAGIGWVDAAGRIVTWNVEEKTAGAVITLPFPVSDTPFRQGDCLVLKDPTADHLLVFNLAELKPRFELHDLQAAKILGVDRDYLVYLTSEDLVVYSWQDPGGIFKLPAAKEIFFDCHFSQDRILIFSRDRLLTFWKKKGEFRQVPLPLSAVSAFFHDGEYIYYGDAQRHLVKFSLAKNRPVWKLTLGQILERPPFAFAGYIVANPADNTILQVNERGSVRWWLPLQSTMRFELVPMDDNLAAFLLNREIKFIDLGQKLVTVFKSRGTPVSKPLAVGHDLYFMLQEGKTCKLQRVGNFYGIEVELEPAKVKWTGRSIRFSLQPRNLLRPSLRCVILDAAGQVVFSKTLPADGLMPLAWIPDRPGNYTIRVAASGANRQADAERSFQVFDPQKLIPGLHLHF